jgi:hypothetical protein
MKQLKLTCDGCELVEHVKLPSGASAVCDIKPEGWTMYRAVVYENDSQAYEILADLCASCVVKIRQANNPAKWKRDQAPPSQAPATQDRYVSLYAPRGSTEKAGLGRERLHYSSAPAAREQTAQTRVGAGGLRSALELLDDIFRKA